MGTYIHVSAAEVSSGRIRPQTNLRELPVLDHARRIVRNEIAIYSRLPHEVGALVVHYAWGRIDRRPQVVERCRT